MKHPAIIVDVDGTLADIRHRLNHIQKHPKDWNSFHAESDKDKPLPLCQLLQSLSGNITIILMTGRDESQREQTETWLALNGICYHALLMRPTGNREDDDLVKKRLYEERIKDSRYSIIAVFEDRPRVVRMWRELGIFVFDCNQTGEEF